MIRGAVEWFDDRLGMSRFVRKSLDKVFPDNWSFMLGEVALYCLVVLVLTGAYLTFFFVPSAKSVTYEGSYVPLRGVEMSEAFASTLRLSFDDRAGLLMRQIHHWAALVFVGAIVLHLCRIFFTGAFRRPRELNWIVGVTMLALAMFNGFSGYSLPDDLLSGTGLRVAYSIALAVPLVGTWIAFLLFGGEFPAEDITSRLFILHVLLVPAVLIGLVSVHLAVLWHQKHTQYRAPGRTEENVEGSRLWPVYALRSIGLFAAVAGVLTLLGGLVQINPVWLYGPFQAPAVSTAAQPDWYVGWLEGALRLFPPWRVRLFGYTISELFWPGIVLPGATFAFLYAWPFLEAKVTGDRDAHHLLDRPRDRPVRTATGIGVLTFYGVLLLAGSQDLVAQHLGVSIASVTNGLRIALLAAPVTLMAITWKLCHDLTGRDELEAEKERIRQPRRRFVDRAAAPERAAKATPRLAKTAFVGAAVVVGIGELLRRRRGSHG